MLQQITNLHVSPFKDWRIFPLRHSRLYTIQAMPSRALTLLGRRGSFATSFAWPLDPITQLFRTWEPYACRVMVSIQGALCWRRLLSRCLFCDHSQLERWTEISVWIAYTSHSGIGICLIYLRTLILVRFGEKWNSSLLIIDIDFLMP